MWSDNDIDNAFQRLNPPEPEPTPFPLDAWLRLETELDKAVIERAVRRRVWKFFVAEVAVVLLIGLGWMLWPTQPSQVAEKSSKPMAAAGSTTPEHGSNQQAADQPDVASAATAAGRKARNTEASTSALANPTAAAPETQPLQPVVPSATAGTASVATTSVPAPATAVAHRRRKLAALRPAYLAGFASRKARQARGYERSAAETSVPAAATRKISTIAPTVAGSPGQQPTAGSAAGHAAVPVEANATAVASGRQHRESPLPSLSRAAVSGAATPVDAAPETAAETAAAVAPLVPIATRLEVAATAGLPAPLLAAAAVPANLPIPLRQPHFYVGLVAAPDLSTVKFVDVERPKLNVGVVLEYRLTNRLLVSTGLLRVNKEYYARREDYDWSAYPRAATRNFYWVDGACTVLDVPLNLRYDAVVRPQARLFGAMGLSSFFMQREQYSYDYTENNSTYLWERSYVNENQHLFSVLNLSLGYEHSLGPHWRVQAEPYAKLPLGGVGAGKVRLTSGGIFFGLKYGF
ncbi:hypothetical protein KB206_17745 [Microvirga sp. STS02]|uniref:porin family protein n=1 Tax=Hymenobacter negativus TaxID=2795026 RepID=UPI0018DD5530|nr:MULTISPECIES: porin family protein [Bacteria]MBH8570741.1 hypothetical protein [Hymenobacter negativus]MBR7210478.1 hypothetical protein [Microvirga sp. STS02]